MTTATAPAGQPVAEVYLYDAQTGQACAAPPANRPAPARSASNHHNARTRQRRSRRRRRGTSGTVEHLVAANVPGWTMITPGALEARYQPRYLGNSGRLFFDSGDALVPQDSNGTQDVYQYEPPGVGGCTEALPTFSQSNGGCVSLISAGTSGQESAFLDASESGDDVFFLTSSRLVPQDEDAARDVYDAHACSRRLALPALPAAPGPGLPGRRLPAAGRPAQRPDPGLAQLPGGGQRSRMCPRARSSRAASASPSKKHKAKKHGKSHKRPHRRGARR